MRMLNPCCYSPFVVPFYVYPLQHDRSCSSLFLSRYTNRKRDREQCLHQGHDYMHILVWIDFLYTS